MKYAILGCVLLAGCAANNPFSTPGTWSDPLKSGGAPMYNLRAQVANPEDLMRGESPKNQGAFGAQIATYAIKQMNTGLDTGSSPLSNNDSLSNSANNFSSMSGSSGNAMSGN